MLLTPAQIEELQTLVRRQTLIFIAAELGTESLAPGDYDFAREQGIDLSVFPPENQLMVAYKFGQISQTLGDKAAKKLTYDEMKNALANYNWAPLTDAELYVINNLKFQAYSGVKNIEGKIINDVNQGVSAASDAVQAARQKMAQTIETEAKRALIARKGARVLASRLAESTGGWAKDFDRIADSVMHNAFDQGRAQQMIINAGGTTNGVKVYKDVYSGACQHCVRLLLTGGLGSQPRIFTLAELQANGSNVGKNPNDWKATIGQIHLNCRCTINYLPENAEWNPKTKEFEIGEVQGKADISERLKGKIKISYR